MMINKLNNNNNVEKNNKNTSFSEQMDRQGIISDQIILVVGMQHVSCSRSGSRSEVCITTHLQHEDSVVHKSKSRKRSGRFRSMKTEM